MAAPVIVGGKVKLDLDEAQKEVFKLTKNVDDLRAAFKKCEAGTDEQLAAFKKLKQAEEDLAKAQNKLNGSTEQQAGIFDKIKGSLGQLPGAAGAAGDGVTGLSGKFKALLANPVVLVISAIVVVLTALGKAFASTRKGADLIAQGMAGVRGAIDKAVQIVGDFVASITSMRDLLSKVGAILSNPIKAFKEFGKEVANAAEQTAKLKKEQQQLERDQINNIARNKELIQEEEALKNIRDNEFNSTQERIAANEKASALEKQRLATLEGLQLREVQRLQKLIELKGGEAKATNDQLRELREAELELADIREESIGRENEFLTNRFSLQKEAEEKAKELRDKSAEEEKTRLQNLMEYTNTIRKLMLENDLANIKDGYAKQAALLRESIADQRRAFEQQYKDRKITLEQLNLLLEQVEIKGQRDLDALRKASREEEKQKEKDFQTELAALRSEIRQLQHVDENIKAVDALKASYDEQLKAAMEKYAENAEQLEQVKKLIDEKYRIERQKLEEERIKAEGEAELERRVAAQEIIANNEKSTLDARKAALDAEGALILEAYRNKILLDDEYTEKLAALTEKRKAIAKEETDYKQKVTEAAANGLAQLSEVAGKETAVGKALAIAGTTIQTYQSAIGAYKGMVTTIPGPIGIAAGVAAAAAALKTGFDAVKNIVKVNVPGASAAATGSPSAPSAPVAPLSPVQASTSINQQSIDDIGNAAAGGTRAVRAYVVEEDNAAAAARAARLQGAAVLGG